MGTSLSQDTITPEKMSLRVRFAQADKEAYSTVLIYIGYLLWWALCAYGLGSQDPETYTYIWGLPAWFFYACIVGYPLLTFALWVVIRLFFKDMPLDDGDATDVMPTMPINTHFSATPSAITNGVSGVVSTSLPNTPVSEVHGVPHTSCALPPLVTSSADSNTLPEDTASTSSAPVLLKEKNGGLE